ncbi:AfsR/SARP family transcriptional regulator [Nonomuraea sp. ZG12]|uniref:AfsR/SARP family transcriptional regulator n=1 Tax=Nonomuraea sp. ZG12 TaxID=3452207 RepID=UPI003F896584
MDIEGMRQKIVLAMLLLEPEKVISTDRLIEAVWDDDPPPTAREQIHFCVSRLRRAMGRAHGAHLIETRRPGYLLRLDGCTLDTRLFDARVAEGQRALRNGDPARFVAGMRGALALWRGAALSDISAPLVQHCVVRLEERRLSALEQSIEIELAAGLDQDLAAELATLTRQHPLRERFHALFMMALYRHGRQAEALDVYRNIHRLLTAELGIEPSADLRSLHREMLAGEHVFGQAPLRVGSVPFGNSIDPAQKRLAEPISAPPVHPGVPTLLPPAISDFTGRTDLIHAVLTDVIGTTSAGRALPVVVFHGRGGAGKTAFVVHLAHLMAGDFPDGQLFAHLHADSRAADPADILGRFLRALGVSGSSLPHDVEERGEVYRNLLGKRRMLIVLDDAESEEQVMPLLPGSGQCSVLVTSRRRLTGLPAERIEIPTMSRPSAVTLLDHAIGGERAQAEPEAVEDLCDLCDGLPLALRIVAARLAARPHWKVAGLVERLTDETRRLDELNHGKMGVRASISLSYNSLSPEARRLFRLLALSEASSFPAWVGAPLLETGLLQAEDAIGELAEAYLFDVESGPGPDRYRFPAMMRSFARERLLEEESPAERRSALERLVGCLLFLAGEAYRREYSGDYLLPAGRASRWALPASFLDRVLIEPLAWYEQERQFLLSGIRQAAAAGLVEHSWNLALSVVPLLESQSYFSDWRESHAMALKAACRHGNQRGEAAMRYSLGSLDMIQRRPGPATQQFEQAMALYEQLDDEHGAALVLRYMAFLNRQNGDLETALSQWGAALRTFQQVGDRVAEAYVLHNMAQANIDLGDDEAAQSLLGRATHISDQIGNRRVGAQVQHRLGTLHLTRGEFVEAAELFTAVLATTRRSGDRLGECHALLGLAEADLRRGAHQQAGPLLERALTLVNTVGDSVVRNRVELALAEWSLVRADLDTALARADQSVSGFAELGMVLFEARALMVKGRVLAAAEAPKAAETAWRMASRLLSGTRPQHVVKARKEVERLLAGLARGR